ncbi:MAG: AGE family epimerase/isomerase [Bryobacterales bacterium]|nr:AGE family epimerase/isomerase [Bryobacterales bacterium]
MKVLAAILVCTLSLSAQPAASDLEKTLKENILAFWYPRSIDTENGGYKVNFGPNGEDRGPGAKGIVTQARMLWFFARMARAGYGDRKQMLDAADHGYKFLTAKMWDPQNGGFYWEVDAKGAKTKPNKHLYGQSFALYAMSEYAMASGRKDALAFTRKFFDLLEKKSHDATYGGYREYFTEDWSATPASAASYMGPGGNIKLMNTHLHLMEAMTTYYRASKLPLARERLAELVNIESQAVVRKGLTACTDQYDEDWTPRLDGAAARVSYGHDLENIWLLVDALDALGQPAAPFVDLFRNNFTYSMKYGWDGDRGGFFYTGNFRQPADNREKSWWVQAEVLVSSLTMYKLTRDPLYWSVFAKTWDFLNQYQIDWQGGEWHSSVNDLGQPRGDKGNIWKAAYHNGRSMIESVALLKQVQPPAAEVPVTETGFRPLFDGKTLNGWTLVRGSGRGYVVENGAIVCPKDGGGNLFTADEYGDFVLRLEWRLWEGGNNGIGIRAPLEGDAAYAGMEIQVLDDDAEVYRKMGLKPSQYTGSVYDVFPAKRGAVKRNGEWNREEIVAQGRRVKVTLNGQVICDVNLDDAKDPEVLKKHPGLLRTRGHIGFLGHGTRVEFRDIRIKRLD